MPFADAHAHPALNAYLWDRDLRRHYFSGSTFNPLSSLTDFKMMKKGDVRLVWSSLHIPEKQFISCWFIKAIASFTKGGRRLLKDSYWSNLERMADMMEEQVGRTDEEFTIPKNNVALDAALNSHTFCLVNTVEGSHVLEGKLERLENLATRGVASITLTHLFPTDFGGHVEGIPSDFKLLKSCGVKTGVDATRGLSAYGREMLSEMRRLRIIPDISHCNPRTRAEIFTHLPADTPIVATHTGVQALNNVDYNLRPDELLEIARRGGIIGVIFMPFWLAAKHPHEGVPAIIDTIKSIHDTTGSWDCIALGTDFDGFTDPPDELHDYSTLPNLNEALINAGLTLAEIEKVTWSNLRAVLRRGWQ